jgi:sigma-B regulation protein RsbU (phosphoserine phosphatase)
LAGVGGGVNVPATSRLLTHGHRPRRPGTALPIIRHIDGIGTPIGLPGCLRPFRHPVKIRWLDPAPAAEARQATARHSTRVTRMPSLILIKSPGGADTGKAYPLDGDAFVIGRDNDQCQIVIQNSAVSRRHALITRSQGRYFIEDLGSRNHTFLNQAKVTGPTQLKGEDRVKICDYLFRFHDERAAFWGEGEFDDEPSEGMTTVQHTIGKGAAQQFLEVQPSERLRALLEISTELSKKLELDPLLPQIAETLFGVFRQADRCFVVMLDDAGRMIPKVVRTRRPAAEDPRFSRTIVRKCLDSQQSYLSEDASADANLAPAQSIAEFRIRSVMCAPLVASDGRPLGALQLDTQDAGKKFKEDDLKLLTIVANLATVSIEKAQAHAALVERERERREIEVARKVQIGFLPKTFPELPGYEFFAFYSPAMSVGGDYYDFITLPQGRVAVVLGDVAGKGVAAALLMAKLSAEVRYSMLTESDPAAAVSLLNDQLIRGGIGDRFVTLAVLIIDPAAHQVTLVNAGHVNPVRVRGVGDDFSEVISNAESGPPLGIVSGFGYAAKVIPVDLGDTLVVFTDGVTDAESPTGARFLLDGLRTALRTEVVIGGDCRPSQVGDRVIRAVQRHADGRAQSDDIALVCVGRTEGGPPTGSRLLPRLAEPLGAFRDGN